MKTAYTFIPGCRWCRKLMNPGTPYFLVGNARVHVDCMRQWQTDDAPEWKGVPEPDLVFPEAA